MTTPFLGFVTQRRQAIKDQMAELRAELVKLKAAEEAFLSSDQKVSASAADAPVAGTKQTIKELIIDVLADAQDGADARQIIDMIAKKHSVIIQRPSLSPQLSRLKEDGLLELHGSIWKGAGSTKKASDHGGSEASSTAGVSGSTAAGPSQAAPVGSSPSTSTSHLRRSMLSGTASVPPMGFPSKKGGSSV